MARTATKGRPKPLRAAWSGWEMLYYFRETSNFMQDYMAMVRNTNLWLEKKKRKKAVSRL